ncbi:MAG TPA: hypothetical protein VK059_02375 [Nocardioidaceae bacterium]|nr:hypothetical protein [Nocardioidaceae bacterium]
MPEKDPHPGPENDLDPGANTQMFQAFVDRHEPEGSTPNRSHAGLIAAVVVALVIVVVLAWLVFG